MVIFLASLKNVSSPCPYQLLDSIAKIRDAEIVETLKCVGSVVVRQVKEILTFVTLVEMKSEE